MKKVLGLLLKVAVSALLLYVALSRVDLTTLGQRLSQIQIGWFAVAIAVLIGQAGLAALRWREVAQTCGATMTMPQSLRFTLIAGLFNQTLPSTVGGDAARIWLLARSGAGWAKSAYSVVVDRAAGLLMLAVLVLACLPFSLSLIRDPLGRAALVLIGLACIGGPLVFAALGVRPWPLLQRWTATRHLAEAAGLAVRLARNLRAGLIVAGLSIAIHLLTVTAAWLAARSVAVPFTFMHSLLLVPPILLITTVPISIAGWGVRESAMVAAFAFAGLPEDDGLLVSVLLGAAVFAVGMVGGVVWLFNHQPAAPEPATDQMRR